jgi:hypothetical protein
MPIAITITLVAYFKVIGVPVLSAFRPLAEVCVLARHVEQAQE